MVEDSPADLRLFQLQCANRFPLIVESATDGERAVQLLAGATVPYDLVLLDLNLPRVHGFDVLTKIRSSAVHSTCAVIVLTSSGSAEDVVRAYDLGASCFVQKPSDLDRYTEMCTAMLQFWTQFVLLPGRRAA